MNEIKFYVSDDHTLKGAVEGFASAYGNGANTVTMVAPFLDTHTMYVLYRKPNGIETERYVMIPTGETEIVDVDGNNEEWNIWINVVPGAVVNIDSAVAQDLAVGFEDWYFVPEDGFLGIVQYEVDLATTFPSAVEGDFVRVVDTNTDWQYLSSVWTDSGTQLVGEESRERVQMVNVSVDPNIGGNLPTVAPDNTEIIITVLNSKLSITDAITTYVARDLETAYSAATSVDLTDKIHIQTATGSKYATASQIQAGAGGMAISDYDTEASATQSVKYARNVGEHGNSKPASELIKGIFTELKLNGDVEIGSSTWNSTEECIDTIMTADVTLQNGRELLKLGRNTSGVTITNGQVIAIIGSVGNVAEIELLDITDNDQSFKVIGMATEDILDNAVGNINLIGRVRDLDTSAWAEGTILYAGLAGTLTSTCPTKGNRCVLMAVVETSNAGSGIVWQFPRPLPFIHELGDVKETSPAAYEILRKDSTNTFYENIDGETVFMSRDIQNGAFKETFDFRYISATSLMALTNPGAGTDLTMQFSDGDTVLDVSALTIAPTFGTVTNPVKNYFYVPISTKVLTKSTSGYPSEEYILVGDITLQDEVTTDADGGALGNQNFNNHEKGTYDLGSLQHIRARLRAEPARWWTGVLGATSGEWVKDTSGTLTWTSTAGSIWQMHLQTYAAKDTSVSDKMKVVNDFTTPYNEITAFNSITAFSDGSPIGNEYFNVFVYGLINKTSEFSPLMVNVPTTGYNNETDAKTDLDGTMITTVPTEFRSVAFPIARLVFKKQASTYTFVISYDLREKKFGIGGTTGTGVLDGEFIDTSFELQNVTDNTKVMKFNAGNQTTGTTRTLTGADQDVDMESDVLTPIDNRVKKDLSVYTEDLLLHGNEKVYVEDSTTSKRTTVNAFATYIGGLSGSVLATGKYYDTGLGAHDTALVNVFTTTNTTNADLLLDLLDTAVITDFYTSSGVNKRIKIIVPSSLVDDTQNLRLTIDSASGTPTQKDILVNGGTIQGSALLGKELDLQYTVNGWTVDLQALSQQLTFDSIVNSTYDTVAPINGSPEFNKAYGLSLNSIAYQQDVVSLGTINFDSVSGINYYDYCNGVLIAGTGSNIVVTNNTGVTHDMMIIPITNTPIASKSASEINTIVTEYIEDYTHITDFELQSRGLNLFDEIDVSETSSELVYTKTASNEFTIYASGATYQLVSQVIDFAFEEGKQYTFNGTVSEDDESKNLRLRIIYTDATVEDIYTVTTTPTAFSKTSNAAKSIDFVTYVMSATGGTTTITDFMINEGTTAEDWQAYNSPQDNFKLIADLLSVGTTIRDEAYPLNGAWRKDAYVGIIEAVAIGATINTTSIPLILETTGIFYAVDSVNNESQYGVYGDTLTLTGTSTVYYQLATKVTTEIEKNGSLIQESNTTFVQLNNFATKYDVTLALDSDKQREIDTAKIIYLQGEVDNLEAEVEAIDTRVTTAESDIVNIEAKTDYIVVTQSVDLDTMESDLSGVKTKTDHITITQAVDLDDMESNVADNTSEILERIEFEVLYTNASGLTITTDTSQATATEITLSSAYTNFDAIKIEFENETKEVRASSTSRSLIWGSSVASNSWLYLGVDYQFSASTTLDMWTARNLELTPSTDTQTEATVIAIKVFKVIGIKY